jgi:cytochrome c-type protein NapC
MAEEEQQPKRGWGRIWAALTRKPVKWSALSILLVGGIGGVVFLGGFHGVIEATNRLEFCIGCHEMRDTVYQEYQKTIHYTNRTGVQAICADCHVPREWIAKVKRKIQATNELYGKAVGTIDTPEKFEAKRLELARQVWARMKSTDSLECRNCHESERMSAVMQRQRARKQHQMAAADNMTCIDCHKGIAHKKPSGMSEEEEG